MVEQINAPSTATSTYSDLLSLLGNNSEEENLYQINTSNIHIDSACCVRYEYHNDSLKELSDSMNVHGLIQPIVVRANNSKKNNSYILISGRRRLEAAKLLGWNKISSLVIYASKSKSLELAINENIQRLDMSPIEEAAVYERMIHELGCTQAEIARRVGKSRSYIANTVRMLKLPIELQRMVADKQIPHTAAKALINVDNPMLLAEEINQKEYTLRQVEEMARQAKVGTVVKSKQINRPHDLKKLGFDATTKKIFERQTSARINIKQSCKKNGKYGFSVQITCDEMHTLQGVLTLIKSALTENTLGKNL